MCVQQTCTFRASNAMCSSANCEKSSARIGRIYHVCLQFTPPPPIPRKRHRFDLDFQYPVSYLKWNGLLFPILRRFGCPRASCRFISLVPFWWLPRVITRSLHIRFGLVKVFLFSCTFATCWMLRATYLTLIAQSRHITYAHLQITRYELSVLLRIIIE